MPIALALPLLLGTAFALQPPGRFHGDEPVARDGEPWLALRIDRGQAALVATTVSVQAVEDPLVDASGERSGAEVTANDAADALVFVRGDALRAGRIERARVDAGALPLPRQYRLAFRGDAYRIESSCDPAPVHVDGQAQYACATVLITPETRQLLARRRGHIEAGSDDMSFSDDGMQQLLFAGDLDRDGKLDLIFDTSDHYNRSRPTLFLSSPAADGAPLREVAHHDSVGC